MKPVFVRPNCMNSSKARLNYHKIYLLLSLRLSRIPRLFTVKTVS